VGIAEQRLLKTRSERVVTEVGCNLIVKGLK
jgi:hypothetical protein